MATDAELYQKALAATGDPARAAKLVSDYRASKAAKAAPAPAKPSMPAAQRRMASAEPPKGGPVGTVTKPAAVPVKEPKVEPVRASDYAPRAYTGMGEIRRADGGDVIDASEKYGQWAVKETKREMDELRRTPGTPQYKALKQAKALRYYGPQVRDANAAFARDMDTAGSAVMSYLRPSSEPAPTIPKRDVMDYAVEKKPVVAPYAKPIGPERAPEDPVASATSYLKSLGYTDEDMKGIPPEALVRAADDKRAKTR